MKRERGFTLIELLAVVALVAIMLAIATPSFRAFIANYRVTAAANELLQGLTLSRIEALKRGRTVVMMPNASSGTPSTTGDWKYGWTIFVDLNGNSAFDGSDILITKHAALESTTTITDWSGSGAAFTSGGSTFVSFTGGGYPKLPSGTSIGGALLKETPTTTESTRSLCLAAMGSARVVKGTVASCS